MKKGSQKKEKLCSSLIRFSENETFRVFTDRGAETAVTRSPSDTINGAFKGILVHPLSIRTIRAVYKKRFLTSIPVNVQGRLPEDIQDACIVVVRRFDRFDPVLFRRAFQADITDRDPPRDIESRSASFPAADLRVLIINIQRCGNNGYSAQRRDKRGSDRRNRAGGCQS